MDDLQDEPSFSEILPERSDTMKDKGNGRGDQRLLGEILVDDGLINNQQLQLALEEQADDPKYLGVILMRRRWVNEKEVFMRIGDQRGVEFVEVRDLEIPSEITSKIPRDIAVRYSVLPILFRDGELAVAMEDPFDRELLSMLANLVPDKIRPGIATRGDLHFAINRVYNNLVRSNPIIRDFYDGFSFLLSQSTFDAAKMLDLIVALAHLLNASDVHLTFLSNEMKIGLRIDGSVHMIPIPTRRIQQAQISQVRNALKIRCGIDASKRNVSQEGTFELTMKEGMVQARVSMLPLIDGEKIVLRLIGRLRVRQFNELGFSAYHKDKISPLLKPRAGLILVSGPTGCGKTTTLYALLNRIPTQSRTIITVEDPVEAQLPFAAQVQVDREKGLTYGTALKSILRQDPDIILIGEIRDIEAASIAVESAMTGHMVLSSIHIEHAAGVILRLLNMGVEPFALASALNLIIAQKLVPHICPNCLEKHPNSSKLCRDLDMPEDIELYWGKGCDDCYFTGRQGRVALFETIQIDDTLRDHITQNPTLTSLHRYVVDHGEQTFREDALFKCLQRLIFPEDVLSYT